MALPKNTTKFRRIAPRIIERLMEDFDLADHQAAGFPGNFGVETAGFTLMQEIKPTVKGSKGGLGWAQWTGMKANTGRRWLFEQWLKRKGAKADDFEANYGFLWRELTGAEKGVLTHLRKAKNVDEATEIVMRKFERPGVEHLDRRKEWGRLALDAYRAEKKLPPARPAAIPAKKPEVRTAEPKLEPVSWWERLLGIRRPAPQMIGVNRGDETLFRAQNQLFAAGYTQVGEPDGLWGDYTKDAVTALLAEQFPHLHPPIDWPLSDEVLAAIAKAGKRKVAASRADITITEAVAKGSTPAKSVVTSAGFGLGTLLTGIGGLFGVPDAIEKASKASEQVSDVMSVAQNLVAFFAQIVAFAITYRWPILILIGGYFTLRAIRWIGETIIMFRTGSIRQTSL